MAPATRTQAAAIHPTRRRPVRALLLGAAEEERQRVGLSAMAAWSVIRWASCKPFRLGRQPGQSPNGRRDFVELLIDCKEDRTLRAVLVSTLRERQLGA